MGGFLVVAQNLFQSAPILGVFIGNGFRPPQWSGEQLTSITAQIPQTVSKVTGGSVVSSAISFGDQVIGQSSTDTPTIGQETKLKPTTYFFDAVFRVDHAQEGRATEHPVQGGTSGALGGSVASGGSIVDHFYLLPARVALEIGMSDAMDSFQDGQWSSGPTKSISAYQTLKYLQALRVPMTVTTRLETYDNMVIEAIRVPDDVRTLHGLRALVVFRQIISAALSITSESMRPNLSQSSNPGTAQPSAIGALTGGQSLQQTLKSVGAL